MIPWPQALSPSCSETRSTRIYVGQVLVQDRDGLATRYDAGSS